MQATFTYTPLKPSASVQKGRKRLLTSRMSRTAAKNLELSRSLQPIQLINSCCRNQCFSKFDNFESLSNLRSTFFSFANQTLKKQFMKDLLLPGIDQTVDYMDKIFSIGGTPVCYKYIHKLFGLSNTFLTSLKGTPHARHSTDSCRPSRAGVSFHGMDFTKREHVAMWLNYQKSFYDIQPDRDEVLLPWSFKGEVYQHYIDSGSVIAPETTTDEFSPCHRVYFLLVWKSDVPDLKCRRFHRFMVCDTCADLNAKLLCRSIQGPTRAMYQTAKDLHIQQVREDRCMYGMRVMEAKHFPQNVMSWVIDGSDASAWSLSHFAQVTHDTQAAKKVKSKVYGIIVHGYWASLYTFNSVLPGGTNVTVEIMHQTLLKLRQEGKPLPKVLYVQLDNTVKDNKSKYVMSYLYLLVCVGVFDEIHVFFFQVGHTHCDQDQIFSRSSVHLVDKTFFTFQQLCYHLKRSCSLIKYVDHLEFINNWRDNVEPMLNSSNGVLAGITRHRLFRIKRFDDKVLFHCKRSVHDVDGPWHDFNCVQDAPIPLTKEDKPLDLEFLQGMQIPYTIPGLPTVEIKGQTKELDYSLYLAGINKIESKVKTFYDNEEMSHAVLGAMREEVEKMRHERSFQPAWSLDVYSHPLRVAPVLETQISPQELSEFQSIMKRNAVDRLYKIENGLPLSIDEIEELTMLAVQADPDDPNKYPFWICEVSKIDLDPSSPRYNQLQVCWYEPKQTRGKKQSASFTSEQYLNAGFSAQVSNSTDKRDKHSKPKLKKRICDWIDKECILVVFSHLLSGGKIPKKVHETLLSIPSIRVAVGL